MFSSRNVVVVQWRQGNVQKSVMHVQRCCFANLDLLLLCRSRWRRRRRCLRWTPVAVGAGNTALRVEASRSLPWVPEDIFFLSVLMVRCKAVLGALSNRKHSLFQNRYFENRPLNGYLCRCKNFSFKQGSDLIGGPDQKRIQTFRYGGGGGRGVSKNFLSALRASVWSKIREGSPVRHCGPSRTFHLDPP